MITEYEYVPELRTRTHKAICTASEAGSWNLDQGCAPSQKNKIKNKNSLPHYQASYQSELSLIYSQ